MTKNISFKDFLDQVEIRLKTCSHEASKDDYGMG
jgi:hypothetical protein